MNRNEYRRAFIMLRAAQAGYGGHARLERRTMTGSLYFVVSAPEGVDRLEAALVGRRNGETYAAPVGTLRRDRRGQLTLAWTFDPRDIAGRPLEAYRRVAVAFADGGCAVVLSGNVEGSFEMDEAAVQRAVCALYAAPEPEPEPAPAADIPEPEAVSPAQAAPEPEPDPPQAEEEMRGDVKIYRPTRARVFTAMRPEEPAEPEPEPEPTPPADPEAPRTAAQALGLDAGTAWPDALEPLRRLFATQAADTNAPGDGFTYVRAPMPAGSGYDACCIGLRADGGEVAEIRYALPAGGAAEPPAGLECYTLAEDGGRRWWTLTVGRDGQPLQN